MSDNEVPTIYSNLLFATVPPKDNKVKTTSFFRAFYRSEAFRIILHNIMYSNHPEFNPLDKKTIAPQLERVLPCYVSFVLFCFVRRR
jgi:hypothetical protein